MDISLTILFSFLLTSSISITATSSIATSGPYRTRLELLAAPPESSAAAVLRRDSLRVSSLTGSATTTTTAASTPLHSGLALGVGNYVTVVHLGTPATPHHLIVDTGSSLTWLQCSPCNRSCYPQQDRLFRSASFRPLPCSSALCRSLKEATLNPPGCSASRTCTYEATYGDSSYSSGVMGSDTLTLDAAAYETVPDFTFGCGGNNVGLFGRTSGIVGLARSPLSLLTQLGSRYPNAFSYCLPTPAGKGYLSIGAYDQSQYRFTPLLTDPLASTPLYYVKLVAVKVAGRNIAGVPPETYASMRTIIDSGTVITRLPPRVLEALTVAVSSRLRGYRRAEAFSILESCWEGRSAAMSGVPAVSLVFDGGAEMRLVSRNVMYDVKERNITCMAFARSRGIAIVGNRQQQTLKVVYDVGRSVIGFAEGGCS